MHSYENIEEYKKLATFSSDVANIEKYGGPRSRPVVFDLTQRIENSLEQLE